MFQRLFFEQAMPSSSDTVIVCGIPNCDTVKKARDWLASHEIPYVFHDFKKAGVDVALVEAWLPYLGLDVLINRKGTTWRALTDAQKASVGDTPSAIALMMAQPSLIKRPVLMTGGKAYAGFSEAAYEQIFNTSRIAA
jgi:arsenate reductase